MINLFIFRKKTKSLSAIYLLFALVSCKNKEVDSIESTNVETPKSITYTIDFPDTVFVNQLNDGVIYYKSTLDTIVRTFGDSKKNRYARFILTTTDNIEYDFKNLKLIVKDSFGALNNREIPFYDIKFNKPGVHYIDGIIDDIVLLDTIKNGKSKDDSLELLRNEERVTFKVIVMSKD